MRIQEAIIAIGRYDTAIDGSGEAERYVDTRAKRRLPSPPCFYCCFDAADAAATRRYAAGFSAPRFERHARRLRRCAADVAASCRIYAMLPRRSEALMIRASARYAAALR